MSNTPRTDALMRSYATVHDLHEFTKTLERELSAATADLSAARATLAEVREMLRIEQARADDAAKARDEYAAERDALRIAMDRLLADIEAAVTDRS